MTESWQPIPPVVKHARMAAMVSYFGIMGLFTGDALVTLLRGAPLGVVIFLWLFRILPLLIFLPGLRKDSMRAYAWLCFVILLYFFHAVVTAFVPGELFYGVTYSILCTAVFISSVIYIRVARKYLGLDMQS